MTLVELLVVVAIIGILLAISVPLLKPMLESRRTSNAAHVLAGAFQHARSKSIEERKSYGIRLIPYDIAPSVSVQLELRKRRDVDIVNPLNFRVRVVDGEIIPYHFPSDGTEWQELVPSSRQFETVMEQFKGGSDVQFNHIGRVFRISRHMNASNTHCKLAYPYDEMNLPDDDLNKPEDAMEYRVKQRTVAAWLPPVVMPRRTVVDIAFSGGETVNFGGKDKVPADIDANFLGYDVIVMFSPAGNVDVVFINGEELKVNETLYFCVGDWDRQVNAQGNPLAEDKKSNLDVPATYWVALHPKTGKVHIAENAPIKPGSNTLKDKLYDARKFAREYYWNVGGY